jgi:periplasmic protein TonB
MGNQPKQFGRRISPHTLTYSAVLLATMLLASCAAPPPPAPAPQPTPPPAPQPAPQPAPVAARIPNIISQAANATNYRRDAAQHIYKNNSARIYKGRMPPLLMAVAVLELDVDTMGDIAAIRWVRGPTHLPNVIADIEALVRASAPYPAPVKMPGVIYTDVWLYDKSGLFQLGTLTEGQRNK